MNDLLLNKPKALIFDWDNTLVDTWPAIHDALNFTLEAMGHQPWSFEKTKNDVRKSMRESFPELFGEKWEKAGEIFYSRFEESHIQQLAPCIGAEELLKHLKDNGYYLSIVSNKTSRFLKSEVKHLQWDKYFSKIIGAGDAAQDKPAIEPVDLALENSQIPRDSNVWFVGDTNIDMECAHACGCTPILVREKAPEHGEFDAHPPSCYFSSCIELKAVL